MLVPIDKLTHDFAVRDIFAIEYEPRIRRYKHENGRSLNGFLYCASGGMTLTYGEHRIRLETGALIYLPKTSHHAYQVDEGLARHVRIDFILNDHETGEEILFSDLPLLLFQRTPISVLELMRALLSASKCHALREKALLLSLLAEIADAQREQTENDVLTPAVSMLAQHYKETPSSDALAAACGISVTHFRRLFRRRFGISPTEYRQRLCIDEGKRLLRTGGYAVSEVAEMLGFESVFYFSRVFKAKTGAAPRSFINK